MSLLSKRHHSSSPSSIDEKIVSKQSTTSKPSRKSRPPDASNLLRDWLDQETTDDWLNQGAPESRRLVLLIFV